MGSKPASVTPEDLLVYLPVEPAPLPKLSVTVNFSLSFEESYALQFYQQRVWMETENSIHSPCLIQTERSCHPIQRTEDASPKYKQTKKTAVDFPQISVLFYLHHLILTLPFCGEKKLYHSSRYNWLSVSSFHKSTVDKLWTKELCPCCIVAIAIRLGRCAGR